MAANTNGNKHVNGTAHLVGERPSKKPRLRTDAGDSTADPELENRRFQRFLEPIPASHATVSLPSWFGMVCVAALGCLGIVWPECVRSGWLWWAAFATSCLFAFASWGYLEGPIHLLNAIFAMAPAVATEPARPRGHGYNSELRPKRLIFIRHGESEANVNRDVTQHVPDHCLHLTAKGREQALDAGQRLRTLLGDVEFRFIVSPYTRAKETLNGLMRAWSETERKSLCVKEDVRLREQEYGNYDRTDMPRLHREKQEFGPFYYRFPEGESPADCYDRAAAFCESLFRPWEDNESDNWVIVGHGTMILVTLMRLLQFSVNDFYTLDALSNCEFVVLERPQDDPMFSVTCTWSRGQEPQSWDGIGLRKKELKDSATLHAGQRVWDGDPETPLHVSFQRRRSLEDSSRAGDFQ